MTTMFISQLIILNTLGFTTIIYAANRSTPFDPTRHPNWKLFDGKVCGSRDIDRIIGGKNAELGAYPWIARIGYTNLEKNEGPTFLCGAVLVSRYYIVTAAHCVFSLPKDIKVTAIRLGEHQTDTNPDCEDGVCADPVQDFRPVQIIKHEKYGHPAFKHDIAVIRLNRPANFTDYVKPICMVHGELMNKSYVGEYCEVAGWGIYDVDSPSPSEVLQTVKLPVVGTAACKEAYIKYAQIGPTQMCVGGVAGQDSCNGDSGGPLMKVESLDKKGPRYYLIGVVSFGTKRCGTSNFPGVYTRLTDYIKWVLDHMH